jgi:hypothetical protein
VSKGLAVQEVTIKRGEGPGAQKPGELAYGYPADNITLMRRPAPMAQGACCKAAGLEHGPPGANGGESYMFQPVLLAPNTLLREQLDHF